MEVVAKCSTFARDSTIWLHHYATRSREEYVAKMGRGNGMGSPKGWDWWDWVEAIPTVECEEMAMLEP